MGEWLIVMIGVSVIYFLAGEGGILGLIGGGVVLYAVFSLIKHSIAQTSFLHFCATACAVSASLLALVLGGGYVWDKASEKWSAHREAQRNRDEDDQQ